MGKNSPSQRRLLELGSAYGMDDVTELVELIGKRGFKKELELLKNEGVEEEYKNVTPLFRKIK